MGAFDSIFHPGDAYKKAEQAAQEGYNQAQSYERPFWQQGQDQYDRLNTATGQLLNPAELENQWSSGYQQSPYAQQLLKQNQASGLDAASSMGLNGSSAALGNIQTGAGNIVSADREKYMNDLMQKFLSGIGLGQNIYGVGANAGSDLARGSMQHGENMAGLQYGRAQAPGDLLGKLAGMGVDIGLNAAIPGAGGGWAGAANAARGIFGKPQINYNSGIPG